jgi:predicted Fe-Mo cluster-binding NifX family protein
MEKLFAITSMGKTPKSFLDLRFGKSMFIVIFNPAGNQYSVIENPFRDEENSGLQLIELLKELKITSIITGEVGPRVKEKLEQEKIQLILLREDKIRMETIMDRINP